MKKVVRLTESDLTRIVKRVIYENAVAATNVTNTSVGKSNTWKTTTSYNLGRKGFDQVLNNGSVFNRIQGDPKATASCINPPFSQDDPLFFSCVSFLNNAGTSKSWLYENTFGQGIPYHNQQLVQALGLAFCPNGKVS